MELVDEPAGCGEVARGGCSGAWNLSVARSTLLNGGGDKTRRCGCISDSLLAYSLKIPQAKNRALHYNS